MVQASSRHCGLALAISKSFFMTQNTARTRQTRADRQEQTPETVKSPMQKATALVLAVISGMWLLNFNMGFAEIPDVLPVIGHIDEAAALLILLRCLQYLGVDVMPLIRKVLNAKAQSPYGDDTAHPREKPANAREVNQ
jgi:predicted lipid-binding transport protein (Tim44 family)